MFISTKPSPEICGVTLKLMVSVRRIDGSLFSVGRLPRKKLRKALERAA